MILATNDMGLSKLAAEENSGLLDEMYVWTAYQMEESRANKILLLTNLMIREDPCLLAGNAGSKPKHVILIRISLRKIC
ncbi:hypothetical protein HNR44_003343 [Geomicrobium halophilum]|uniref:Uncharacterized protein n=1 Tax=Geomicrobium halophilum TaxID=549000 RepID=A0A841PVT4_9BACL|nr:hypothetical protein [Geomicrobium halophilum]MBB6451336.1 hypothetical protein [Geomicrobium halophilum]